jgi:AdoMet-dependent heme synthase
LLHELADAGIRSVAFSGGEPLLREDICELIRHGKDAGIADFGLVTNGYFASIGLARALSEAGLGIVQVSLDGVDTMDHASVRGCEPTDFYRALRAIRVFKDCGLAVHVATILSPRNVRRAPEMAMFCQALAVDVLRYCTFVPVGRAANPKQAEAFAVEPSDLDQFTSFVRALNEKSDARFAVSIDHAIGPWSKSGDFHCESGQRVAYISAEGDLYPCPSLLSKPFRVGNVFETPVRELLTSEAMSTVRRISRERIPGPCAACSNQACTGGCRGLAYATTGDVYGGVPYCNYCRVQQVPQGSNMS